MYPYTAGPVVCSKNKQQAYNAKLLSTQHH